GGLSIQEKQFLDRVSSFEKGAWMLGVGRREAPGIDAVDLTNAVGVSLKTAASVNALGRNVEEGLEQVSDAGYYNVQIYVNASTISARAASGLTKVQRVLGSRITKVVVFARDGIVTYSPTPEQTRRAESERREAELRRAGHCSAEQSRCE
ncbi:MAG TPA: hypothetical protein VE621_14590, partial [Bryobacteraceae bacterium]|nr:hypothetical protein [Bryobacteraceae bacterium]